MTNKSVQNRLKNAKSRHKCQNDSYADSKKRKCVLIIRLKLFAITIVFDGAAAAFRAAFLFLKSRLYFTRRPDKCVAISIRSCVLHLVEMSTGALSSGRMGITVGNTPIFAIFSHSAIMSSFGWIPAISTEDTCPHPKTPTAFQTPYNNDRTKFSIFPGKSFP